MSEEQSLLESTEEKDLWASIEAIVFVSKEPISPERITEALLACEKNVETRKVNRILATLLEVWADPKRSYGRGLTLKKLGGGYAFVSSIEQAALVKQIFTQKPVELSKSQLEVLSIVAYRQPITRVDVDEVRGVDSSFAIKRLMQLKLLKILGKSEGLGRPLLYGTTKHFLEFFSLNSLNDLPTLKQYESLGPAEVEMDLNSKKLSLKDLFLANKTMLSDEVKRLSDDALKSLDDALLRIDNVEKTSE
jgi:segregation and condensation protein B